MRKFDTCFFERYAKNTLTTILGEEYDCLLNKDRPDLQSPDQLSIGIEVTRAMEENKKAANMLIGEMAGIMPCKDDEDIQQIIQSGYGYGLTNGQFIGKREYEYWALALPLKRILESKIEKAANGFYGKFETLGLYVFSKDDLTDESVSQTCSFVTELQQRNKIRYDKLYLSEISNLYVCELNDGYAKISRQPISLEQRHRFFIESI